MNEYEIKTTDGELLDAVFSASDETAERWFQNHQEDHPDAETMLFRNRLLMAVSDGLTIRSYRADNPAWTREAVAS